MRATKSWIAEYAALPDDLATEIDDALEQAERRTNAALDRPLAEAASP